MQQHGSGYYPPIQPQQPKRKVGRSAVAVAAGLAVLVVIIASCSSGFGQGVKDGYKSTTTIAPATTSARPLPAILAATPSPAAVTTGAKAGAKVGRAPAPTTEPPAVVPDDAPLSAPDPDAEVNAADVPTHFSSCKAAKAAGAAPLRRGEPGYSSKLDKDGDGVACET